MKKILKRLFFALFFLIENFYVMVRRKKHVLLVVEHGIMLQYIQPVYDLLQNDKRIKLRVCFVRLDMFSKPALQKLEKRFAHKTIAFRLAKHLRWDLIVFSDHNPYFRKECKKIYIGHGLRTGKKVKGFDYLFGPYSYTADHGMVYDKLLVASEFIVDGAKKVYPQFYPHVKAVGSLLLDAMLESVERNRTIRDRLSFDPHRKTIMCISTWGPYSLMQSCGEQLLEKIPALGKSYNIILTIHHFNYLKQHSGGKDWKELIGKIRIPNCKILTPDDDPYPFLSIADLLITDMTSLGLYFPVFERPIIFVDNKDAQYGDISLTCELKKIAHTVSDLARIESDVPQAFQCFNSSAMKALSEKIFSHQGSAKKRYSEEIYDSLGISQPGQ